MILSFSNEKFVQRIIDRTKIITIREDRHDRWQPGMKIHFWKSNPRNKTKFPYNFGNGVVKYTYFISIKNKEIKIAIDIVDNNTTIVAYLFENIGYDLSLETYDKFAISDGFEDAKSMFRFFPETFIGKIIAWDLDSLEIFPQYRVQLNG